MKRVAMVLMAGAAIVAPGLAGAQAPPDAPPSRQPFVVVPDGCPIQQLAGVVMKVRLLRALAQSRSGDTAAAAAEMHRIVAELPQVQPADLYSGQAWWIAAQVFDQNAEADAALMALAHGTQWVRRQALPHVPEAFRDSFLQRNATNRALLAAADRRLAR